LICIYKQNFFKVEIHLSILQKRKKNQFEEETEMEKKKKNR